MQTITPNLAVKNIQESISFYKELGFELIMAVPEDKSSFGADIDESKKYIWAMMKNGGVELMFQEVASFKEDIGDVFDKVGASASFYMKMDDVDGFYKKLAGKVEIVKELHITWYGMQEFYIKDCNGYILGFASQVKS